MTYRPIEVVENKVITQVDKVVFVGKNKIEVHLPNGKFIELSSVPTDYGYDSQLVITKEA